MKLHLSRSGPIVGALLLLGLVRCSELSASPELSSDTGAPGAGAYGPGYPTINDGTDGSDGGEAEPPPPEVELEETFKSPVATGEYVWAANPSTDRVALVNAVDLTVQSVEVGEGPTYIAAVPVPEGSGVNRAIVINVEGDDASLLTENEGAVVEQRIPLHPRANSWAVSASGRWAIAWTDVDAIEVSDPTEGFQSITVIRVPDTDDGPEAAGEAYRLSAGYRPHRVFISADESHAYVVGEPGITVVSLGDVPTVEQDVALAPPAGGEARARDVSITPDGRFALVRREGDSTVEILEIATGEVTVVALSGPVTDLDLIDDGSRAIAVVRQVTPLDPNGMGGAGGMEGTGGAATGGAATGGVATGGAATGGVATGGVATGGLDLADAGASGYGVAGGAGMLAGAGMPGAAGSPGVAGAPGVAGGFVAGALGTAGAGDQSSADGRGGAPGGQGGVAGASGQGGAAPEPTSGGNASEVFILRLPDVFDDPTAFDRVRLEGQLVGSVSASIEGSRALLFTNAVPSDRVTILNTADGDDYLASRVVPLKSPVQAVFPAPDAKHAIALLKPDPAVSSKPGAFSVVPIERELPPYLQDTDAPPRSVTLASTRGVVTVRDDVTQQYGAYVVRLPELQVDSITLKSPPLATGLVPTANRAFVAQEHPQGRITFIHLTAQTNDPDFERTLTGFELATRVVGDAGDSR